MVGLCLAGSLAAAPGCVWLDDFDKFQVSSQSTPTDAGLDAGTARDAAPASACKPADCAQLDSDCTRGVCNEASGACVAMPAREGDTCFDPNPCTVAERCQAGACVGQMRDCSAYDDECSQGICDPDSGGCAFGPNHMSQPCDDANPCTLNDRCTAEGLCEAQMNAPRGASCTDYNECTGTSAQPDACDAAGRCTPGSGVAAGTRCDDDNECTTPDACDGQGECNGEPVREGAACNTGCTGNTSCQHGACRPKTDGIPAYDKQCFLNWCGRASLCQPSWEHDRVCDCGCPFSDPDCNDCSPRMCESDQAQGHPATSWCDQAGKAIGNCPDSLKSDGKCDCGCQFVDPDCGGGACCGPSGARGCANAFVEQCVCERQGDAEPSCCKDAWTQRCADLAVAWGCMVCP
jgi:hypothetical protein